MLAMSSLPIFSWTAVRAQQPAAPEQLKAEVVGHRVELSWQNPDMGEVLAENGFESDEALQGDEVSLEVDGWTVKTTNTSDYSCTWFNYPTRDYMGADDFATLIHSGERSAAIFLDVMDDGEHDMHQDEWLISPVLNKAAYLQFSSFIDPRILTNGADPDFPDHYAVVVSTDGGETWGEPIWDARYDAAPEGGWQTVTLALAEQPTEAMRVAFRAYGDFLIDEETGDTVNTGLFATWAIDDVKITASRPSTSTELVAADFETAEAEGEEGDMDMTFEALEGWTVKNTALEAELGEEDEPEEFTAGWFRNPVMEGDEVFPMMVTAGARSAMVMPAYVQYQDEWLISPVVKVKAGQTLALQFSYTTSVAALGDNEETEDVEEEDFWSMAEGAGYYEVLVSKDGGKNWMEEPVWTMANDDKGQMTEYGMYTNTVKLAIEAEPTDEVQIAFRARAEVIKDEETDEVLNQILGGFWAIDDITISSVDGASIIAGYKIQLDGKDLVEGLTETSYVDKSKKTTGKHTYSVCAVSLGGVASEPATVEVTLADIKILPARNFVCKSALDTATGTYTVMMTWDAPETDYKPAFYNIYADRVSVAAFNEETEESGKNGIGRTGLAPGLYEYEIEAVYQTPDTVSERVLQRVVCGVRFGVTDLKAESEGQDVVLAWTAPQEDGYPMGTYTVYRGGEKVAEGLTATSYRDQAVAAGLYHYTVIAVYADGVESIRTSVYHQAGDEVCVALPYEQTFNTTFMPDNWRIENQSDRTPDKYTWYFDDQSRLGIKGDGFDGCYAAIDCSKSGFYRLNATLELPAIDLTTAKNKADVTLSFNYSYAIGGIFKAGIEWSFDGVEWYMLGSIDKENGYVPADDGDFHIQKAEMRIGDEIRETDLATADKLYLRFHYEAARSYHWAIDNVAVSEGTVAVERLAEDVSVSVSAANGLMQVRAAQEIQLVEIYAMNGVKLMERAGNGSAGMTLAVPQRGPAVIRVTTAQGVKVVKMLL